MRRRPYILCDDYAFNGSRDYTSFVYYKGELIHLSYFSGLGVNLDNWCGSKDSFSADLYMIEHPVVTMQFIKDRKPLHKFILWNKNPELVNLLRARYPGCEVRYESYKKTKDYFRYPEKHNAPTWLTANELKRLRKQCPKIDWKDVLDKYLAGIKYKQQNGLVPSLEEEKVNPHEDADGYYGRDGNYLNF